MQELHDFCKRCIREFHECMSEFPLRYCAYTQSVSRYIHGGLNSNLSPTSYISPRGLNTSKYGIHHMVAHPGGSHWKTHKYTCDLHTDATCTYNTIFYAYKCI